MPTGVSSKSLDLLIDKNGMYQDRRVVGIKRLAVKGAIDNHNHFTSFVWGKL